MPIETRKRLAEQQAALVTALAGLSAAPPGFDADRVEAAAFALVTKRMRAVARAWPGLADELSEDFEERFRTFAAMTPMRRIRGPLADGQTFARWLAVTNDLPEDVRFQALAVDLRYLETPDGLVRRRFPKLKVARLAKPSRLIIAVRLPRLGEYWLVLRRPSFRALLG